MAVVGTWSGGTLPDVVGDVTLNASQGVPSPASPGLRIGDTPGPAFARIPITASAEAQVQFYFRTPTEWPTSAWTLCGLRPNAASLAMSLAISGQGAPGQLRMVTVGGVIMQQTTNGAISVDTEYRAGIAYSSNFRAASVVVYEVNGSSTPIWTATAVDETNWGVPIDRVDFGRATTNPTVSPFLIDNLWVANSLGDTPPRHPDDVPVVVPPSDYPLYWYGPGTQDPNTTSGDVSIIDPGGYPSDPAWLINQQPSMSAFVQWNLPDSPTVVSCRLFAKTPSSWASAAWALASFRPTLATNGPIATISGAGQPGQLRLTSGASNIAVSPNNTLTLDTWYRFELQHDQVNSRARVAAFHLGTVTPLWTSGWVVHTAFNTVCNYLQVGRVTGSPTVAPFRVSDILIDDTVSDWLGSEESSSDATVKVWDGTQLRDVASTIHVWQGGQLRQIL